AGTVRQHFVHVHIGLRARSGLPHDQRELSSVLSSDYFVGSRQDGVRLLLIEQSDLAVHGRGRTLHLSQGLDEDVREALARNMEVLQRALRLCAPQPVCGDFDFTEGIAFYACHLRLAGWFRCSMATLR